MIAAIFFAHAFIGARIGRRRAAGIFKAAIVTVFFVWLVILVIMMRK
jgi:hypothetical protein